MKVSRVDAALTYLLAGVALWISYTALVDLALRAGLGQWQAALWPLVVDGLILAATRAVVEFDRHNARRYAWVLLSCAAATSIVANMAHALLPPGPLNPAVVAAVAVMPPIAALAMTHLAVVRSRVRQDATAVAEDAPPPATPQVVPSTHLDAPLPEVPASPAPADFHDAAELAVDAPEVEVDATPDAPACDTPATPAAPPVDVRQLALDLAATYAISNRAIAQQVGVSEATVRRWKAAELAAAAEDAPPAAA